MTEETTSPKEKEKLPSFLGASFVILFTCAMMFAQIFILKQEFVTHISLLFATVVAALVALASGFTWDDVQEGMLYGCKIAMLPMLILMMVGILVASWIASGTIPSLVYYGLQLISPTYFLFTAVLICCISSLMTGSSWTTAATFGVAFMGSAEGLDMPAAMTAGAVISGAIFGDKISPVSDSTNLAAGVAEANLFYHIRSMFYTTGPAIIITMVIFFVIGLNYSADSVNSEATSQLLNGIKDNVPLSIFAFLPPIIVLVMAYMRISALAVMVTGCLSGAVIAVLVQGIAVGDMMNYMDYGYKAKTGVESVDKLLNRGGLQGMMWTISLGFIGLSLGGLLEKTKVLKVVLSRMDGLVGSSRTLIPTHVFASIATNLFSASQYIAIIIPTRMLVRPIAS